MALYNYYITSVILLSASLNSDEIPPCLRLRLHECDFTSIKFHDFETASKSMRFVNVYTEWNLGKIKEKEESTISFLSLWQKVHPNSPGLTMNEVELHLIKSNL